METIKRMCEIIEHELHKISEKGITMSNLDTAYKLIDMYKDIKNTYYWETKGEYYDHVLMEMRGGYSHELDDYSMRGRKRDKMGRYAMDDGMMHDRYMNAKMTYRADKSHDSKQRLMDSLEDYMEEFTNKIKEMARDVDTMEEKEMINKFMMKLQNIR